MLATLQTDCRQTADILQTDCRQIAGRFQTQFGKNASQFRTVQFWITEIRLGRQDLHDAIRTGRPPLDDLDTKILTILDKCLFESAHSIAERLLIAHSTMLWHLHDSVDFKSFHLHWMWIPHLLIDDLREKRKEHAELYCHSCILPNVMAGIILWLVMSHGLSLIHYHVTCGLCREIMWSQNRDLIFRAKNHVYDHMETERLRCCQQIPKWYQKEQRLFCDKYTYSTRTSDLSSRKGAASKTTCDSSRQLPSSHKSSFNRLVWRTRHSPHAIPTYPIHLIWPQWLLFISYSQRKTRTDSGGWRGLVLWVPAKDFEGSGSTRIEQHISGLSAASSRNKSKQGNGDYVRW
jgi:hypothetical protein